MRSEIFPIGLSRLLLASTLVLAAGRVGAGTLTPPTDPPAEPAWCTEAEDVPAQTPQEPPPQQPQQQQPQQPKDAPSPAPPEPQPQPPKEEPPAGPPPPHTGVKATVRAIPGDFWHLPTRANFWTLAIGGALALAVHPIDDEVNAHLRGSQAVHNFFWAGKVLGGVTAQVVMITALYGYGRATNNRVVSHLGMDLLRSCIVVGTLTYAIKLTVQRDRPNGDCCSFPSGHSSVTFATASVLWRHLGWKAAVPTYTVASYVALSRLHENVHFLSDVVFGASLGIVVGRTVVRHGRSQYTLAPVPVRGGMMVVVSRNAR